MLQSEAASDKGQDVEPSSVHGSRWR